MTLFDPGPVPVPEKPLSRDRKRTLKRNLLISAGIHPATRVELLFNGEGHTCGDCKFLVVHDRWFKCRRVSVSACASSDIRKGWPACKRWEQRED